MSRILSGGIIRGRPTPFLIFMLIFTFCMLVGSWVYAGGDRKGKKQGSGESTKKEERARRDDKSTQAAIKENIKATSTLHKADRSSDAKRGDGGKDSETLPSAVRGRGGSDNRTGESRRNDRSRDSDRSTTQSSDRIPPRDRVDRDRSDDTRWTRDQTRNVRDRVKRRDRDEVGEKIKKKNPGWGKKIIRPGSEGKKRIPPRPGGRRPPPPPGGHHHDGDIIIIEEEIYVLPPPPPPIYPYVVGEYIGDIYEIPLPCGVIVPDGIEPAFLEKIEHIREMGRGDSRLVCLFQTVGPMTSGEINYLFEHGVTFYRFLTSYTAIIDLSVQDIFLLVMDLPNFRWIGDYKPEYKYCHDPPESSRRGAYVISLLGDSNEFREDLKYIGIQVVTYFEETEDYYVIAEWERFPEIADLWWVEMVHKEPESFSSVYGHDTY